MAGAPTLSRRAAIAGAVGVLAAPRIARAAPVDLVLGTNGGEDYKRTYQAVYAPFERKYNARIVPVFGDGGTLLARAIAEKAAPSMDVAVSYQGGWLTGRAEGVFEKVDYDRIPNMQSVYDFLHDPDGYAPFTNFAAWGIVYNRDAVSKPPLSFKALWDSAYNGQVLVGGIYHWQIHLAAFAQAWAGDQSRIDVAFARMKELAPRLAGFYGLSSDAQSKLTGGVGSIATWYSDTAQRLRNQGIPLGFQVPEEGAFIYPTTYQAIAGTQKRDLVEKLIGQFYDPDCALALARAGGRIPGNRSVTLDAALQKDILSIQDVLKAHNWNWQQINTQQNAWLARWNAEIVPLVPS